MSTVVQVVIQKEALETLIGSEFNLCIVRMVEVGDVEYKGNVVFAMVPFKDLRRGVTLQWEDKYQVFETTSYKVGSKVTAGTETADIKLGQQATFDVIGGADVTGGEDVKQPLHVRNDWKEGARVGVRNFDPTDESYHSLFLSPEILTDMTVKLTPTNKFAVFWHQQLVTDTITDLNTIADPFVFEINHRNMAKLIYGKEKPHWTKAPP
ncbi:hypothetical protein F5887DRAFT_918114 [Amanita rubescens]|nr:hypothetical protein F5887DRAFT_1079741 [Amanita rubescens]KAF8344557.1 hypothetical protein F5887DRAFT_918114 [Amanita rubescens]